MKMNLFTRHLSLSRKPFNVIIPDDVFTERKKRLFLVVSKHLKHDGLSLDVVHEGLSDLDSNLRRNNTAIS